MKIMFGWLVGASASFWEGSNLEQPTGRRATVPTRTPSNALLTRNLLPPLPTTIRLLIGFDICFSLPLPAALGHSALWGVFGLPAIVAFAISQRIEPRLQVLDEGGGGRLVDVLQLVGVVGQVVEFLLPVAVLDVFVGLGPDGSVNVIFFADETLE